jgi:murein L,D-transpeptidase YcbB/YkuD
VRIRRLLATARKAGMSDAGQRRIRLNLDRARILPGPWTRHIVVDAASSRLWYYQGGKTQGEMKVVTGMAETPTPMLAGMVRYAILNPYWMVPPDLAQKRVAPKVLAGKSLHSLRYEARTDWSPSATTIDPATIDWKAVADGRKKVWLRQLPGDANAMGKVKFMFPNEQGIYLHDTPRKELMKASERHFSNGCVRLEDAARLGKWLLGKPLPTVKQAEKDIALARPVPVYLTYFTVTATKAGVGFIKDAYGRDGKSKD